MGIEYSAFLAWGHEIEEKHLRSLPGFEEDPFQSTYDFYRSTESVLEFIESSDTWSDPKRSWVLVISSTLEEIAERAGVFKLRTPSEEERLQFTEAYAKLTGKPQEPERLVVGHIH